MHLTRLSNVGQTVLSQSLSATQQKLTLRSGAALQNYINKAGLKDKLGKLSDTKKNVSLLYK